MRRFFWAHTTNVLDKNVFKISLLKVMFVFIAHLRRFATYDPVLVKKDCDFMAKACLYSAAISEPLLLAKYVYIVHV